MKEQRFRFEVPGSGAVSAAFAPVPAPTATVVIAHGAGAGMDHPFLVGFAEGCVASGLAAMRFNFPYMEAGKRSTDRAPVAVAAWRAAHDAAIERRPTSPVWASGKSFGGRMASMAVAEGMPAAGLIFLGYPLHPPGKPDQVRADHLAGIRAPMLFLQGSRDPFARSDRLDPVVRGLGPWATLIRIEGGTHSLNRSQKDDPREVGASLAPLAARFIEEQA